MTAEPCPDCTRLQYEATAALRSLHIFVDSEWDLERIKLLFACLMALLEKALAARCAGCQAEAAVDARLLGRDP